MKKSKKIPKRKKERRYERRCWWCDDALYESIEKRAYQKDISNSEVIRQCIKNQEWSKSMKK
jgi:PP-loop superfamily ATP-utilizing enzyme